MSKTRRVLERVRLLGMVLCVVSVSAVSEHAHASPLFELVGSSVGTGGLNGRASGASAASTYFNPALLPRAKQGLELGWLVLNDAVSITLDARARENDIPISAEGQFGDDYPSVPTAWLENGCDPMAGGTCNRNLAPHPRQADGSGGKVRAYQVLGLVNHIGAGDYLSLGFYAMVPLNTFTQAQSFFVDEREQYYSNSLHPEMYGDRLTPISLSFGAGSHVLPWLSLGLSFTLNLTNTASAGAYVGDSDDLANSIQLATALDVAAGVSPHGAVLIEPIDDLDISLTLHSPQQLKIDTGFSIYLPNGDLQTARRTATHAWLPWTLALGVDYDVFQRGVHAVAVTGTATFERWSKYVNRQSERPLEDYEFADVFTGAIGARYRHAERWTTLLDVNYRPTPVPAQSGRTNYVDNDRVGLLAGVNYDLPVKQWDVAFRFGAQLQTHFLLERYQTKYDPTSPELAGERYSQLVVDEYRDGTINRQTGELDRGSEGLQTNNPGWPGFSSSGFIMGGGLSVALLY